MTYSRQKEATTCPLSMICSRQLFLTLVKARGLNDLQKAKESTTCPLSVKCSRQCFLTLVKARGLNDLQSAKEAATSLQKTSTGQTQLIKSEVNSLCEFDKTTEYLEPSANLWLVKF